MSTTTLATPDRRRHPLGEGEYIVFTAGRTEITVQCVRPCAAYSVTVYTGTLRIEDQCSSYPTEALAREVARSYAQLALAEAGR
jgi:hypothetical protein